MDPGKSLSCGIKAPDKHKAWKLQTAQSNLKKMVWFNILCIYLRAQEKVNTVDMDETGMMRRLDYEMLKKVTRNLKRLQDEAQVMKLQSGLWSVLHFTLPFLKEFTHSVSCLKELFKMAETYRNVLFCKKKHYSHTAGCDTKMIYNCSNWCKPQGFFNCGKQNNVDECFLNTYWMKYL